MLSVHTTVMGLQALLLAQDGAMLRQTLQQTFARAVALSDWPSAVVAIRNGSVVWVSRSDSLIKAGFYPPSRGAFTSPTALPWCLRSG